MNSCWNFPVTNCAHLIADSSNLRLIEIIKTILCSCPDIMWKIDSNNDLILSDGFQLCHPTCNLYQGSRAAKIERPSQFKVGLKPSPYPVSFHPSDRINGNIIKSYLSAIENVRFCFYCFVTPTRSTSNKSEGRNKSSVRQQRKR